GRAHRGRDRVVALLRGAPGRALRAGRRGVAGRALTDPGEPGGETVAATPVIDVHMHIYPSREQGLRNKASYQVWEYGEKPEVGSTSYGGDVADALTAIRESAVDRAVAINLFAIDRARAAALAELPADLAGGARERAIAEIDGTMGERM